MPNIYCDGGTSPGGISRYHSSPQSRYHSSPKGTGTPDPFSGSREIKPSSIIINGIIGLVLLYLVNLLPSVHIPINILTVLIVFFTGPLGVVILTIVSVVGFI